MFLVKKLEQNSKKGFQNGQKLTPFNPGFQQSL